MAGGRERLAHPRLAPREGGDQHGAERQAADRPPRAPAAVRRLDDREHDRQQRGGDERGARGVEAGALAARPVRGQQAARERQDGQPDRDVDEEDPAPPRDLGQGAARDEAGRGAEPEQRGPDAERAGALAALGERRHEDRQGGGGQQRGAEALQPARADEQLGASGGRAAGREQGEHGHAGDEHAPAAEDVGGAAAQQQEAAEHEQVGVDHPGQRALGEAEVGADRGQRRVDDRVVDRGDELGGADQREDQPAAAVGGGDG